MFIVQYTISGSSRNINNYCSTSPCIRECGFKSKMIYVFVLQMRKSMKSLSYRKRRGTFLISILTGTYSGSKIRTRTLEDEIFSK